MYIPLHIYSHYSLLRGLNNPQEIIDKAIELKMDAIALTDINNISGSVEFYKYAKSKKIKPIIGELINTDYGTLLLIALNSDGYVELLKINAELNSKKSSKGTKLELSLDSLKNFDLKDIVAISGHEGSTLYNCIIDGFKVKDEWEDAANLHLNKLKELFNHLYIELQFSEIDSVSKEIKDKYLKLAIDSNIELLACPRVYYLNKEDAELQRILRATDRNQTLNSLNKINDSDYKFFQGYNFYLPDYEEFKKEINNDKAIENTNKLSALVEDYNIEQQPNLPKYNCPRKKSSVEYFRELCNIGWKEKIVPILQSEEQNKIYRNRVEEEIKIFENANLFDYFLILRDIINYGKSKGYLFGAARGSSAGCLSLYLIGITQIDSIKYELLFSRFYNEGRKGSLPDVDIDVEARGRDDLIEYARKKYGKDRTMQIATYGTLAGRAAIKAVLRAYGDTSFSEQNQISKNIPDKAKISDKLQELKDAGKSDSLILWSLRNKQELSGWCTIDSKDNLVGPLADRFGQAIRLEGVKNTLSKHAAGIVIGSKSLKEICPLVIDKEKNQVIGVEMNLLEYISLIKYDLLVLGTLDALQDINN